MRKVLILIAMLVSTAVLAAAYAELTVDPDEQEILVGDIGEYTLTLNTDQAGDRQMSWDTGTPVILARVGKADDIEDQTLSQTGSYNFDSSGADGQEFKLHIKPTDDAEINEHYDVSIAFGSGAWHIGALVTATVIPIPELSTIALTSAGLLGMIGLVRTRRKDT